MLQPRFFPHKRPQNQLQYSNISSTHLKKINDTNITHIWVWSKMNLKNECVNKKKKPKLYFKNTFPRLKEFTGENPHKMNLKCCPVKKKHFLSFTDKTLKIHQKSKKVK